MAQVMAKRDVRLPINPKGRYMLLGMSCCCIRQAKQGRSRYRIYLHCKFSHNPRERFKQFDRKICRIPSRTAVLGRRHIRCKTSAICHDSNIRNNRHRQWLLDDWIWKRVKPCVDARVAWCAWSGQTQRGSVLWIPSGRIVRGRGNT